MVSIFKFGRIFTIFPTHIDQETHTFISFGINCCKANIAFSHVQCHGQMNFAFNDFRYCHVFSIDFCGESARCNHQMIHNILLFLVIVFAFSTIFFIPGCEHHTIITNHFLHKSIIIDCSFISFQLRDNVVHNHFSISYGFDIFIISFHEKRLKSDGTITFFRWNFFIHSDKQAQWS